MNTDVPEWFCNWVVEFSVIFVLENSTKTKKSVFYRNWISRSHIYFVKLHYILLSEFSRTLQTISPTKQVQSWWKKMHFCQAIFGKLKNAKETCPPNGLEFEHFSITYENIEREIAPFPPYATLGQKCPDITLMCSHNSSWSLAAGWLRNAL